MEHDIIAYVYPHGGHDSSIDKAKQAIKADPRCVGPRRLIKDPQTPARHRDCRERQSTEPPEKRDASALDYLPSLVVRFSDIPRTNRGLVFGSHPKCDVVLDYQGVSNFHFSLTFDQFNRPIIEDLNTLLGTQVTYSNEGQGFRKSFHWIVGGHYIPETRKAIVITISEVISFQIVVQVHDIKSPAYISAVESFQRGTVTTQALLEELGLSVVSTRGSQIPGIGDIHLKKYLGQGSFGVVTHHWNVSTGEERMVKAPHPRVIENGQVDRQAWAQEACIMGLVSHRHIVKLIKAFSYPEPELHLEYMPYGSLEVHKNITYTETFTITCQCSSALAYLHGLDPPIAHRDIKPANILVERRSENGIFVKLADFGIAREGFELSTLCGTYKYLAPEIHSDKQLRARREETLGYTPAVDIWSLGVVVYELLYGLPHFGRRYQDDGLAWCERIAKELRITVQRQPTALGSMLPRCMVAMSPDSRYDAAECCNFLEILDIEGASFDSVTSTSYSGAEHQTTFRHAQNGDDEASSTIVDQPKPTRATTSSEFVRSGAPPPKSLSSSSRITQRCEESKGPSSSIIRRDNKLQEGQELEYFLENYSANEFNPLYVGSSLASQLGGNNSEDWASQQNSARNGELLAELGPGTPRSSIPRGESGCNQVIDDWDEEMARAGEILQAISRGGN